MGRSEALREVCGVVEGLWHEKRYLSRRGFVGNLGGGTRDGTSSRFRASSVNPAALSQALGGGCRAKVEMSDADRAHSRERRPAAREA